MHTTMKRAYFIIINCFIFVCMLISTNIKAQLPNNDPTWQVKFSDEFNNSVPLDSNWFSQNSWLQTTYIITCDFNHDSLPDSVHTSYNSYRTDSFKNCQVDSGILNIMSKHENYVGKCWDNWYWGYCYNPNIYQLCAIDTFPTFNYTTGMLRSKHLYRFGYFEIKCQLPVPQEAHQTQGIGPNFWMWGAGCNTATYSEIDVFEFAGEYEGQVNHHTCNSHFKDIGENDYHSFPKLDYGSVDFSTSHIFGVEWGADYISYYIDNNLLWTSTNPYGYDMCPMQLIVDINHPSFNFCDTSVSSNFLFPYVYKVDYVKVWQLKQYCDSVFSSCNFNLDNFDYAVYKSISLGGSGCTPTIANGKNVTLRATDGILLDSGFTVELGAEFEALTTPCQQQVIDTAYSSPAPTPPPDTYQKIHGYN